jgi:uncharacterized protein
MVARLLAGFVRIALSGFALAILTPAGEGHAQAPAQPSTVAVALAREIIIAKASSAGFDTIGPGVIEKSKDQFLQLNPSLVKDLNEVAAKLKAEYAPRFSEPVNEAARVYAGRFTEQELKDILAFYKSPAGKKVVIQEPLILQESMTNLDRWASNLSEEIMGRIRAEMKKKGHDL